MIVVYQQSTSTLDIGVISETHTRLLTPFLSGGKNHGKSLATMYVMVLVYWIKLQVDIDLGEKEWGERIVLYSLYGQTCHFWSLMM